MQQEITNTTEREPGALESTEGPVSEEKLDDHPLRLPVSSGGSGDWTVRDPKGTTPQASSPAQRSETGAAAHSP